MIDLHTHSLFSDGDLLPSEHVRRYEVAGYKAVAITDHMDISNVDEVMPKLVEFRRNFDNVGSKIKVIVGAELTHVPIKQIPIVIKKARDLGADLILVHGQTLAEPVVEGTNITALNNDIDILAHPGLITVKEARLAAKKGIYLEITTRKGHSWTNGHVVKIARKVGAKLLLNNDMHRPEDILKPALLEEIACGAGLSKQDYKRMLVNAKNLIKAKTGINVGLSLL